jgi:glycosyltransferase involved in cell wall biosynthesis
MTEAERSQPAPLVTVILPTYNRATFLAGAIECIAAQTLRDWELVIVDDGSTDDTTSVIGAFRDRLGTRLKYVAQENQGPAGARNRGLDLVRSQFVAFFDSDDLWARDYLERLVDQLRGNPDVDWLYCACRRVDLRDGRELDASTFYAGGAPLPFLALRAERRGTLRVIHGTEALVCQIEHGLFSGLQNSVFRSSVFAGRRLPPFRIGEDRVFIMQCVADGVKLGYLMDALVTYRVHQANSSATSLDDPAKLSRVQAELVSALTYAYERLALPGRARRALRRAIARQLFWDLGYGTYLPNHQRAAALAAFRNGLRWWPFDARMWKTYMGQLATRPARSTSR